MIKGIGAQLYTLRDFCKTPQQVDEAFAKVAKMGYDCVQVSGICALGADELKDLSERRKLTVAITHTPADRLLNDLDAVMRYHDAVGCKIVGLGCLPAEYKTSREGYLEFLRLFNPVAKELHENGFIFSYHNHALEFTKFDGITGMEFLLYNTDPDVFKFTLDTYWLQVGGMDPAAFMRRIAGRIAVLHLKDLAATPENTCEMAEVGCGNLDWEGILAEARRQDVAWYMVEQDVCKTDPFDCLNTSLRFLRSSGYLD